MQDESRRGDAPTLRTVIVDDSALARLMIRDALTGIAGVRVVGNAAEGGAALEVIEAVKPGLIILDVEMPGMNGIQLLREMNARGLDTPVLMCSRLTRAGAEVTTEALLQGAYDFVAKPDGQSRAENVARLRSEISQRIAPLISPASNAVLQPGQTNVQDLLQPGQTNVQNLRELDSADRSAVSESSNASFQRQIDDHPIDVVLIGCSTGGPAALRVLLAGLSSPINVPVMIVQHIPAGFSEPLARRLDQITPLSVSEATDGAEIQAGKVYLAPGGKHLAITRSARGAKVSLVDTPPVHGCRPSIDVMLESALHHFGGRCLVVTLTGMGCDGAAGAQAIRSHGGLVFAQQPETCTVSSMPRHTIRAGADRVADLPELSRWINTLATKKRSDL